MTTEEIYAIAPNKDGWRVLPSGNGVTLGDGVKLGNEVKLGNGVDVYKRQSQRMPKERCVRARLQSCR